MSDPATGSVNESERVAPGSTPSSGFREPSWPAFADRMKREAPTLRPVEHDEQWKNLHAVYIMGYSACLELLKVELEQVPPNESSSATPQRVVRRRSNESKTI